MPSVPHMQQEPALPARETDASAVLGPVPPFDEPPPLLVVPHPAPGWEQDAPSTHACAPASSPPTGAEHVLHWKVPLRHEQHMPVPPPPELSGLDAAPA